MVQSIDPRSNHRGNSGPVPSYMYSRYQSVWGDTLAQIAASHGVDPRQVAAASGIDPSWHMLQPLPPGTACLIPFHPVPARRIVASSPDPGTDPRGQLTFPDPATTIQAQSYSMPYPYGV